MTSKIGGKEFDYRKVISLQYSSNYTSVILCMLEFPVFAMLLSGINHKTIYHYSPSTSSFYKSGAIRACNNRNRWNKMTSGHYGYLCVLKKRPK